MEVEVNSTTNPGLRSFNRHHPQAERSQSPCPVSDFDRRGTFRCSKPDERYADAFAFKAEDTAWIPFATERFEVGQEGVESFLPPLEEANGCLLARLGDAANGESRLILEALPRCAIRKRGNHTRTHHVEPNEDQSK